MNKKIIIILAIIGIGLLLLAPVCAKQKVKVKISTDEYPLNNKGIIVIKLVDSKGKPIKSSGKINYTITDKNGNYIWKCKSYNGEIREKYDIGKYKVKVVFKGDSHYKKAKETKTVTLKRSTFDAYNYYDTHNWGLNQEIDDYIEYNYWDEEIYDDPYTYDGEGP